MDTLEILVRREVAKENSLRCKIKFIYESLTEEVIGREQARSEANKIMNRIVDRSYWRIKISEAWRMLEQDQELQSIIVKKIRRQEIDGAEAVEDMEKQDRLERRKEAKTRWLEDHNKKEFDSLEEMMRYLTVYSNELRQEDEIGLGMDWSEVEKGEHHFLEVLMDDLGIRSKWDDMRESVDMEIDLDQEMEYMDRMLKSVENINKSIYYSVQPDFIAART